ncbi:MAG TPA: NepR family anti-sigma factor [Ensifer sp.]|jgi:hypothetical protein|uniref:NepR family anti-sigma factor n=1 Tax=Ensifer sp. TaxID=1872086 RepID=UPI002E12BBFD|nr:NepR family anti-sigma factor [Ensifer sp.]
MDEELAKPGGADGPTDSAAETLDHGPIGAKLKALYRSLEQEPVPEFFLDLLQKLDEAETASKDASSGQVPG